MPKPRVRMFAGPNGSGKSTLKSVLPKELLGVYLSPDGIETEIWRQGCLDFQIYGSSTTAEEVLQFFSSSPFLNEAGQAAAAGRLAFDDGKLNFLGVEVNSYLASEAVDFLRQKLLTRKVSLGDCRLRAWRWALAFRKAHPRLI